MPSISPRKSKSIVISLSFALVLFFISLQIQLPAARADETAPEIVAGAKKEGKLVIYHTPNVAGYRLITDAFKQKYPFIAVESFRTLENKLLMRVLAEYKAKKYLPDVIDTRGFSVSILKENGILMSYRSPNFKFISQDFIDPDGHYWANSFTLRVVAYNTNLVSPKDAPKSYQDLLDPKWKGKLYMDDRDYEWYGNILETMGKEKGLEFMKKLSKQDIKFRSGRLLLATLLSAGEVPMFLTASGHTIEGFREKGAPIKWVTFDPILVEVGVTGIASHAPHPSAAKLFVDFLSSKDGQALLAVGFGKNPVRSDAKHRFPNLDTKGHSLHVSSLVVDYNKYEKDFRTMFMKQ